MIEIGALGGSRSDVMKRLLQEMWTSAEFARCVTEADTEFGYWWRYQSAPDHPDDAITLMIHIAKVIADAEAHKTGKTYLVGRAAYGVDAIYAFASNHPDARNAAINIMYDCPPDGKPARRPGIRRQRHSQRVHCWHQCSIFCSARHGKVFCWRRRLLRMPYWSRGPKRTIPRRIRRRYTASH